MPISLANLRRQHEEIHDELHEALQGVIDRSDFILGAEVHAFEHEFAAFCGSRHCIGVGTGLDALGLALRGLGVGAGDEVITAANTFAATVLAVLRVGATPVLIDHNPDTHVLDVRRLSAAITSRTRAIVPVHLYGHPAEMETIRVIADEHGLMVVEDACQAHGARYNGRRCGSLGHAAAFSFNPSANLGAMGDGGAIVTDNDELAAWARMARDYGTGRGHRHVIRGENTRLDTLQAAVLRVKLRYLDQWNATRRWLAAEYGKRLGEVPGLRLPEEQGDVEHAYHLYVVECECRDDVVVNLRRLGIEAGMHYPIPIHRQPAFRGECIVPGSLTATEESCDRVLSLPLCPFLTLDEVETITAEMVAAMTAFGGSTARPITELLAPRINRE